GRIAEAGNSLVFAGNDSGPRPRRRSCCCRSRCRRGCPTLPDPEWPGFPIRSRLARLLEKIPIPKPTEHFVPCVAPPALRGKQDGGQRVLAHPLLYPYHS